VLDGAWLSAGAAVVSIGSTRPDLREVDDETLRRAGRVIVDHRAQALAESGDIRAGLASGAIREDDVVELPPLWRDGGALRPESGRVLLFKPSGTAAQDLAVARIAYDRALAAGAGRRLAGFLSRKPR
jgi:ornithine cyclodeaminase/alanine dehydrogenase